MIRKIFLTVAATLVAVTGLFAQELPDDPEVRKGVLDNGMTYYIRHNNKPANQAEFWIFDNVGALQEEDSQQGLAHFLEHMAFNGTENFPGKNMINYLESIGVKFGANLNAFTAQEMTCYNMSNVPVTREGVIDSALLILHDWAYYITLDGDEIDNERGVIVEELRTRQNASWRTNEKLRPYLYGDTRYTTRNIIGSEEGLRSFDHKELRDFYHRWYRTDMQALFIVGDFDVDMMEQKVIALMEKMAEYCGRMKLFVVPFTEIQEQIRDRCPEELFTIIMRRFMMRLADALARDLNCRALVTGESLGQVASQTMDALAVSGDVTDLPVLRPVIGMDKEEIVQIARKIGTFETSILPYEDCCTVFTPRHPRLRPLPGEVEFAEEKLDIQALIQAAVDSIERVQV